MENPTSQSSIDPPGICSHYCLDGVHVLALHQDGGSGKCKEIEADIFERRLLCRHCGTSHLLDGTLEWCLFS